MSPAADLRIIALFLLGISAVILTTAFAFQYLGGLHPCVLCLYQRWPYVATIGLAGIGAMLARRNPGQARAVLALCGLVFLVGAGIAIFHVGVELHWWAGTASCGDPTGSVGTIEGLRQQLLKQPVVRCDAVAWSFLGVSMAGWNALLSFGLAGFSFYSVVMSVERGR